MGSTMYSSESRSLRSSSLGYHTSKNFADVSEQTRKRQIHEAMNPKGLKFREARDSEVHPHTVPVIVGLDLTGSMGSIPHELVKDGLPTLMSTTIQRGVKDLALCFIGVGDHECDSAPLQVGQFESGDEELDMWLTRTFLEGGGGGNAGESYLLAWYFAAFHTVTDAWEKRKEKGFLFTIGDEPNLKTLPSSAINEIIGSSERGYSAQELLEKAQERWNVYHIVVDHSRGAKESIDGWKAALGERCLVVSNPKDVALTISKTVSSMYESGAPTITNTKVDVSSSKNEEVIL